MKTMKYNFPVVTGLLLSGAFFMAGADTAAGQNPKIDPKPNTQPPATAPVNGNTQSTPTPVEQPKKEKAPRIFKKDKSFEMRIFDYDTRRFVQAILNASDEDFSQPMVEFANQIKGDEDKAEYLLGMIRFMIESPDERVRAYGAMWTYFLYEQSGASEINDKAIDAFAEHILKKFETEKSPLVRGNLMMAIGTIGDYYNRHSRKCMDAVLKGAEDSHPYVRSAAVSELGESVGLEHFPREALEALEKLKTDDNSDVSTAAKGVYDGVKAAVTKLEEKEALDKEIEKLIDEAEVKVPDVILNPPQTKVKKAMIPAPVPKLQPAPTPTLKRVPSAVPPAPAAPTKIDPTPSGTGNTQTNWAPRLGL